VNPESSRRVGSIVLPTAARGCRHSAGLIDRSLGIKLCRFERTANQFAGDAEFGQLIMQFAKRILPGAHNDRVDVKSAGLAIDQRMQA
jgi:hypothetical protein